MVSKKKGKAKRGRQQKGDPDKVKKQKKVSVLIHELEEFVNNRINEINIEAEDICQQIVENYAFSLKDIPEEYHSMTLKQIDDLQNKTPPRQISPGKSAAVSVYMSKLKTLHEQKTVSANRKKNVISITSMVSKAGGSNNLLRQKENATMSNSQAVKAVSVTRPANTPATYRKAYNTPMKKKNFGFRRQMKSPSLLVTPKFDPRTPIPSMLMRKPKIGETIMSLSGSPLQNTIKSDLEKSKKPALLLTLGDGRVLNIAENTELNGLNTLQLDKKTKATLAKAQETLAGILRL